MSPDVGLDRRSTCQLLRMISRHHIPRRWLGSLRLAADTSCDCSGCIGHQRPTLLRFIRRTSAP